MRASLKSFALAVPLCLFACTATGRPAAQDLKNIPVVVTYALAPGASVKRGVTAVSDTGSVLFSPMSEKNSGESINTYSGGSRRAFPSWVRVTWRTGADIDFDRVNGGWKGGTVVGDHTVKVLERIPDEVLAYAQAKRGRAIVLRFRLKDDGVLFAWDVQESGQSGHGLMYSMHGGDF